MKFLARFQRLERSRRSGEAAGSTTGERFRAIEPVTPLPEVHGNDLGRFAPPVDPPLELQPRTDAQPFVRCPTCGADSPLGTRRCVCGAALDTLQVVAFNTALWDRHREELEDARRLQAERQALGEAIAREVAEREGMVRSGGVSRAAGAVLLLGFLALVLLPRGPLARGVFAFLLGAVCVRAVVAWARSRSVETDPGGGSTVDR